MKNINNTITIDGIDKEIIRSLMTNARTPILEIAKKNENIEVVEVSISPFDLQKADELFITNVITGIQPITKYRKKEFTTTFSEELVTNINNLVFG